MNATYFLALDALWNLGKSDSMPELRKKKRKKEQEEKAASWLLTKAFQVFMLFTSGTHYWHNSTGIKLWTQLCTHFTIWSTYLTAWILILTACENFNHCSSLNMNRRLRSPLLWRSDTCSTRISRGNQQRSAARSIPVFSIK